MSASATHTPVNRCGRKIKRGGATPVSNDSLNRKTNQHKRVDKRSMPTVRITMTVDIVERDGQLLFSATDTEIRPSPIAGELRGFDGTIARAGSLLVDRLMAVFAERFGQIPQQARVGKTL